MSNMLKPKECREWIDSHCAMENQSRARKLIFQAESRHKANYEAAVWNNACFDKLADYLNSVIMLESAAYYANLCFRKGVRMDAGLAIHELLRLPEGE